MRGLDGSGVFVGFDSIRRFSEGFFAQYLVPGSNCRTAAWLTARLCWFRGRSPLRDQSA